MDRRVEEGHGRQSSDSHAVISCQRESHSFASLQNPAFGPSQIRELTEIFVEKSLEAGHFQHIL